MPTNKEFHSEKKDLFKIFSRKCNENHFFDILTIN